MAELRAEKMGSQQAGKTRTNEEEVEHMKGDRVHPFAEDSPTVVFLVP
jgi:hypothetical protein